jgi:hypothetical protein
MRPDDASSVTSLPPTPNIIFSGDSPGNPPKQTEVQVTPAQILLRHVRVNAIADYYDVQQLRTLANPKIQHILNNTWTAKGFPSVVKEVFSSNADSELKEIMTLTAAEHIEELLKMEDFAALELMSDFTTPLIRTTVATLKSQIDASEVEKQVSSQNLRQVKSQLRFVEVALAHVKSVRRQETTRTDDILESIDQCLKTLRKTKRCRNIHCGVEFQYYIERGGNFLEYELRCSRCNCRHPIS